MSRRKLCTLVWVPSSSWLISAAKFTTSAARMAARRRCIFSPVGVAMLSLNTDMTKGPGDLQQIQESQGLQGARRKAQARAKWTRTRSIHSDASCHPETRVQEVCTGHIVLSSGRDKPHVAAFAFAEFDLAARHGAHVGSVDLRRGKELRGRKVVCVRALVHEMEPIGPSTIQVESLRSERKIRQDDIDRLGVLRRLTRCRCGCTSAKFIGQDQGKE